MASQGTTTNSAVPRLFDPVQVAAFSRFILDPAVGCLEMRLFGAWRDHKTNFIVPAPRQSIILSGWYDSVDSVVAETHGIQNVSVYVTVNPVQTDLLCRARNKLVQARKDNSTNDTNVIFYRWLYIDCDSVRPDGISATQEELAAALALRDRILAEYPFLRDSAIWGTSGNGGWILVRLADLPNDGSDGTTYRLLGRVLSGLAEKFGKKGRAGDLAFVDEKTKNASRVMCLPGTLKCKGENDQRRPWRLVTIEEAKARSLPVGWQPVPVDMDSWIKMLPQSNVGPSVQRNGQSATHVHRKATGKPTPPPEGIYDTAWAEYHCRKLIFGPTFGASVAGQEGHKALYHAASTICNDFGLTGAEGFALFQEWNQTANPPESDHQVQHKWEDARRDHPNPSLVEYRKIREWARPTTNGDGCHADDTPWDDGPGFITVPPVDFTILAQRVETAAADAKSKVEDIYRDTDFLRDLARLELQNPGEAEAIKATLRRISGFREKAFKTAMAGQRFAAQAEVSGDRPPSDETEYDFSDLGNGRRLVEMHGSKIRYCKDYGDWLVYDGRRWSLDHHLLIERMAQEVPARILTELPPTRKPETIEAFRRWYLISQSKERLTALLTTARSMVAVTPNDLDRDPWLLNVQNGTIDLQSGKFRQHAPRDLITKICNTTYDPSSMCPIWDQFIEDITSGNSELANYLQRAVGYGITGVIREHVFFFLYGTGRNGKGTFLNTVFSILGDYANEIDSDLLIAQNNKQHPTGLTEFEGRRFVSADESDEGRRLSVGVVKKLTGGNPIQARRMHEDFYTFRPTHHLFYAANHKPEIRDMTPSIWRRLKLIPFEVCFDDSVPGGRKPDLELESKLMTEASGILNWMLAGCRDWQAKGLAEPKSVQEVTADYKDEMDSLGWYIEERCVIHPVDPQKEDSEAPRVRLDDLYSDYKFWSERSNMAFLGKRKFASYMTDRGFKTYKQNSKVFKLWLRLKTVQERIADGEDPNIAHEPETTRAWESSCSVQTDE